MKYLLSIFILLSFLIPSSGFASFFPGFDWRLIPGFSIGAIGGINGGYELECKHVKTNRGYYAGLKIDKNVFCCIRLEEEFCWQWNEVNSLKNQSIQLDHVRGRINIWSLMTNGIFDIPFNCCLPARPYLGGGIGYAQANGHWKGRITPPTVNNAAANNAVGNNAGNVVNNGYESEIVSKCFKSKINKGGFAWQVIAGLNFSVCLVTIGIEYRFFKTQDHISNHKLGLALSTLF